VAVRISSQSVYNCIELLYTKTSNRHDCIQLGYVLSKLTIDDIILCIITINYVVIYV